MHISSHFYEIIAHFTVVHLVIFEVSFTDYSSDSSAMNIFGPMSIYCFNFWSCGRHWKNFHKVLLLKWDLRLGFPERMRFSLKMKC